jgi:hypothetical protein
MEPPPPSLEAMVRSTRSEPKAPARTPWLWWGALVLLAAGLAAYVAR